MNKGDIILIPFPFTDLSGNKLRPALVLAVEREDVTVAFITTIALSIHDNDIPVMPDQENGLKKKSYIKIGKIACLDKSLAIGKIGKLSKAELIKVDERLIRFFDIK